MSVLIARNGCLTGAFKALGIKLTESDDPELLLAALPEGWTYKEKLTASGKIVLLMDDKNRCRVHSEIVFPDHRASAGCSTRLLPRYTIGTLRSVDEKAEGQYDVVALMIVPGLNENFSPKMDIIHNGGSLRKNITFNHEEPKALWKLDPVRFCFSALNQINPHWLDTLAGWD